MQPKNSKLLDKYLHNIETNQYLIKFIFFYIFLQRNLLLVRAQVDNNVTKQNFPQ